MTVTLARMVSMFWCFIQGISTITLNIGSQSGDIATQVVLGDDVDGKIMLVYFNVVQDFAFSLRVRWISQPVMSL